MHLDTIVQHCLWQYLSLPARMEAVYNTGLMSSRLAHSFEWRWGSLRRHLNARSTPRCFKRPSTDCMFVSCVTASSKLSDILSSAIGKVTVVVVIAVAWFGPSKSFMPSSLVNDDRGFGFCGITCTWTAGCSHIFSQQKIWHSAGYASTLKWWAPRQAYVLKVHTSLCTLYSNHEGCLQESAPYMHTHLQSQHCLRKYLLQAGWIVVACSAGPRCIQAQSLDLPKWCSSHYPTWCPMIMNIAQWHLAAQ